MKEKVIETLKEKANVMTNAWYALHVLNYDRLGPYRPYLRERLGVDRQLCFDLIQIICRYLENKDVSTEIEDWLKIVLSLSQLEETPIELANLRARFLKDVIDKELYGLREYGILSGYCMREFQLKISGIIEFVKKEYMKAALGVETKESKCFHES